MIVRVLAGARSRDTDRKRKGHMRYHVQRLLFRPNYIPAALDRTFGNHPTMPG